MTDDFYSLFDRNKPPATASPGPPGSITTLPGTASSYAAAALRREAEAVERAPEGTRNDTLNAAAFKMGRHVGAGNIDANTVRAILAEAAARSGLPDHEIDTVLRDAANSGINRGTDNPRHPTPLPDLPALTVLEAPDLTPDEDDAFWDARPVLNHLHTFARARRVSPWALLGVTLARVATATPWTVCLPPIIGTKASLNFFVGLVGSSGAGKGAAEGAAGDAVSVGIIDSYSVGSGEGIAHGYMRRVKNELEWLDDRHAVMFTVPEVDTLAALGDRKGATLLPQLRSAWSGEKLGFGYADPTKRILIPAHEYRLCLVVGIQPRRAGALLDDAEGGTPQRFLWMPTIDREAPDVAPSEPVQWRWETPALPRLRAPFGGIYIDVCDIARNTVISAHLARVRGDGEALDGHALLAQLKTAAILGIIEGRYTITDADWDLADVIARKSIATRQGIVEALRAKAAEVNHGKAEAEGHRAVHVAETVADAATKRVCGVVVRKLRREAEWVARSVLTRAAGRDTAYLEDALERLIDAGQIEADDTGRGTKYKAAEVKA